MRIIFILPCTDLTGGNRVIATYANRLRSRGHDVLAVSPARKPPSLKQQFRSLLKGKGLLFWPKHQTSHFDQLDVPLLRLNHAEPVTDADVPDSDVVIATWWETAEWVVKLSSAKGAKAYFMQDYGAPGQELEEVVPTWFLPLHIITISQWLKDLIEERCGKIPISLISNAVDFDLFYAPPRSKQPHPTIGMVYDSLPSKGIGTALKAVQLAQKKIPDLQVIAFGSSYPDEPLPQNTKFLYRPPNEELKEIYSLCDAWLFSSLIEGFGLPILEAMACRTPVIGTSAGAAPELLAGGSGILVEPQNVEDMANAISRICMMPDQEWIALSNAAYAKATQYTWDDATDLFEAALYTAIERHSRG